MAKILDGKKVSEEIGARLQKKVSKLSPKPKLVIIQVGDLPGSNAYIRNKIRFAEKIGTLVEHRKLPGNVSEKSLSSLITICNRDKKVHGIIVQEPLPRHLRSIPENIIEEKRVDGGKYFLPATTKGILTLLEKYRVNIAGKKVVMVGRSKLVGVPTALAMLEQDATVTVCHSKTKNLAQETKQADILIVAASKPKLITQKHVSRGQVVIDVGINALNKTLVGDVDSAKVSRIVRALSPVPGGVGPMTVASLFENLLEAYKLQA